MKLRAGFVSNSSSSSFMGGIGVVKDWKKFYDWIEKLQNTPGIDKWNIPKIAEVNGWDLKEEDTRYTVTLPMNDEPEVHLSKEDHDKIDDIVPDWFKAKKLLEDENVVQNIVMFSFGNDEGDSEFWDGDECDYDIDLDWFDAQQQEIYNGFSEENGIVFVDKYYGAGRNG